MRLYVQPRHAPPKSQDRYPGERWDEPLPSRTVAELGVTFSFFGRGGGGSSVQYKNKYTYIYIYKYHQLQQTARPHLSPTAGATPSTQPPATTPAAAAATPADTSRTNCARDPPGCPPGSPSALIKSAPGLAACAADVNPAGALVLVSREFVGIRPEFVGFGAYSRAGGGGKRGGVLMVTYVTFAFLQSNTMTQTARQNY